MCTTQKWLYCSIHQQQPTPHLWLRLIFRLLKHQFNPKFKITNLVIPGRSHKRIFLVTETRTNFELCRLFTAVHLIYKYNLYIHIVTFLPTLEPLLRLYLYISIVLQMHQSTKKWVKSPNNLRNIILLF